MNKIIRKPYWNFENEENWLNEMSQSGYCLIKYTWCKYVFESCERGEYIYRLEYLEYDFNDNRTTKYIEFLEEMGVEYVSHYMRWVYFRKKASDGPFEIYSDIDSKITHLERISKWWISLTIIEFLIGISNMFLGIMHLIQDDFVSINLSLGIGLTLAGLFFLSIAYPVRQALKRLQRERNISEI